AGELRRARVPEQHVAAVERLDGADVAGKLRRDGPRVEDPGDAVRELAIALRLERREVVEAGARVRIDDAHRLRLALQRVDQQRENGVLADVRMIAGVILVLVAQHRAGIIARSATLHAPPNASRSGSGAGGAAVDLARCVAAVLPLALALRRVHGAIGKLEQNVRLVPLVREDRDADAGRHGYPMAVELELVAGRLARLLRGRGRVLAAAQAFEHQHELVAAEAPDAVSGARHGGQGAPRSASGRAGL